MKSRHQTLAQGGLRRDAGSTQLSDMAEPAMTNNHSRINTQNSDKHGTGWREFSERMFTLPNGATIAAADWSTADKTLVCVHGLTSSSRAFVGLANEMPDYRILAVDCRGRGKSSNTPPFGMVQHADDLIAVMDAAGIKRATLVGHSMGAYVVGAVCAKYPERVERLVFVDGGYFFKLPSKQTPEEQLESMLGTFLTKLEREWKGLEEYIGFYEQTQLYPNGVDEYGRIHFQYDLIGKPDALRARIAKACITPDWCDILDRDAVSNRLKTIKVPLLLIRAPGGLTGNGDEVLPDPICQLISQLAPNTRCIDIPDTNHHTVLFSKAGSEGVAAAIKTFIHSSIDSNLG